MIEIRTGIGTDVHQLSAGVPMHVAGLSFPDIPDGTPVITRRECGKKITVLEVIPPPDVD